VSKDTPVADGSTLKPWDRPGAGATPQGALDVDEPRNCPASRARPTSRVRRRATRQSIDATTDDVFRDVFLCAHSTGGDGK